MGFWQCIRLRCQALHAQPRLCSVKGISLLSHNSSTDGQAQHGCLHHPRPAELCSCRILQAYGTHLNRRHIRAGSTGRVIRHSGGAQLLWCDLQQAAPPAEGLLGFAPGGRDGAWLAGRGPAAARRWPQRWAAASAAAIVLASAVPGKRQAGVTLHQS